MNGDGCCLDCAKNRNSVKNCITGKNSLVNEDTLVNDDNRFGALMEGR